MSAPSTVSVAADRKAKLAAKAAKPISSAAASSARPLEETPKALAIKQAIATATNATSTTTANAAQQQSQTQNSTHPTPTASPFQHLQQQYPAYSDDMDDMDATMYIDAGVNALQLTTRKPTQAYGGGGGLSRSPGDNDVTHWEDDVEGFSNPSRAGPITPKHHIPRGADELSPPHDHSRYTGVLTLDSAEEEQRLDAIRMKQQQQQQQQQKKRSMLEDDDSDISQANSPSHQRTGQPSDPAAGHQVYVRSRNERETNTIGIDGAPINKGSSSSSSSSGTVASNVSNINVGSPAGYDPSPADSSPSDAIAVGGEDLDDQPYLLEQQRIQREREREREIAAASAASAGNSDAVANDPGMISYNRQILLQRELADQTNQRAAAGLLSPEEQRLALMRAKRPPLILDWARLNTKELFTESIPRGGWLQCRLIKRSTGLTSFLHPRYEFYTEEHQGGLFLATARKSSKTKPNYHLTTDKLGKGDDGKSIDKSTPAYVGKVAATLSRSDYVVYDAGFNASKSGDTSFSGKPREEIGHINYKPHLSGKTPRKLAVILPILFENSHKDPFVMREFKNEFLSNSSTYQHLYRSLQDAQQRARVPRAWTCLLNKPPRYHADTGQYVLDFCGRAPQVSVKNFQLVYPEEPDEVLFQLGRLNDDNFSVDFRFPLSPQQAFAIALSSLDYKWTVD